MRLFQLRHALFQRLGPSLQCLDPRPVPEARLAPFFQHEPLQGVADARQQHPCLEGAVQRAVAHAQGRGGLHLAVAAHEVAEQADQPLVLVALVAVGNRLVPIHGVSAFVRGWLVSVHGVAASVSGWPVLVHRVSLPHLRVCGPAPATETPPVDLHFCKFPALKLATGPSTEVLAVM